MKLVFSRFKVGSGYGPVIHGNGSEDPDHNETDPKH